MLFQKVIWMNGRILCLRTDTVNRQKGNIMSVKYYLIASRVPPGSVPSDFYTFLFKCTSFTLIVSVLFVNFFAIPEIVQRVMMQEYPPFRPKLSNIAKRYDVPGLVQITEKCWNEQPEARPEFEDLKRQIRKMSVGR